MPLPLQHALARLAADARVHGVLLIGSLTTAYLTAASDYDIVVIADHAPLWYVGVSRIGGRFADVLFVATHALDQIRHATAPPAHDDPLAAPWRWLATGTIVHDPSSRVQQAQQAAQAHGAQQPPDAAAAYSAWFALNYNLAVVERMVQSPDAHYQTVATIRMALYGHSDLWYGYFTIRQMPWPGDKSAYSWLHQHDPDYVAGYLHFIAEPQPAAKLAWYRTLADTAAAPLGGRCPMLWAGENLRDAPLRVVDLLGEPT
jgi:hypothetical protein